MTEDLARALLLACFITGAFGMMSDPRSRVHTLLMDLCILTGGAGFAVFVVAAGTS